jgi:hypothetical protein
MRPAAAAWCCSGAETCCRRTLGCGKGRSGAQTRGSCAAGGRAYRRSRGHRAGTRQPVFVVFVYVYLFQVGGGLEDIIDDVHGAEVGVEGLDDRLEGEDEFRDVALHVVALLGDSLHQPAQHVRQDPGVGGVV